MSSANVEQSCYLLIWENIRWCFLGKHKENDNDFFPTHYLALFTISQIITSFLSVCSDWKIQITLDHRKLIKSFINTYWAPNTRVCQVLGYRKKKIRFLLSVVINQLLVNNWSVLRKSHKRGKYRTTSK